MGLEITQVDAFANEPFRGNPAAVCLLPEARPAGWMLEVAREMNLSETAFLTRRRDGFDLRWFTPEVEVDLCGHATLASAHVLWERGELGADEPALFFTRSGRLTARRRGDWIEMDFPSDPPAPVELPEGLEESLGATVVSALRSRLYQLVELEGTATLRAVDPDFRRLAQVVPVGLIVTCRSESPEHDFLSRFFGPSLGVDEDPVTGSAHCVLAPYWGEILGKREMTAYQASARGGVVKVRLEGERVMILGHAVTVLTGELIAPP